MNKADKAEAAQMKAMLLKCAGAKIVRVVEDDGNIHIELSNKFRISIAYDLLNDGAYLWDDRPVRPLNVGGKRVR